MLTLGTAALVLVIVVVLAVIKITGQLPTALHVEVGSLPHAQLEQTVPTFMCGRGERAMTAASILEARGRVQPTVVGGPTDWAASDRRLETGT